jgi:phosphohistidine phosphatase
MDLFLIRHASAADGPLYGDDADRPLTADGRRAALAVGEALQLAGVGFDKVIASPLVRAVETAELLAVSVGFDGELAIAHELEPGGSVQRMLELLGRASGERVALVGHLPSMGNLLGALLGRSGVSMSKMSVVRLEHGERSRLVWVITPRRLQPVASLDAL